MLSKPWVTWVSGETVLDPVLQFPPGPPPSFSPHANIKILLWPPSPLYPKGFLSGVTWSFVGYKKKQSSRMVK